jgi:predicted Zn-dependent protease
MKKTAKTSDSKPGAGAAEKSPQAAQFGQAIRLFQAGDFRAARKQFAECGEGPDLAIAESAHMHARMCDQRLERSGLAEMSPEERYTYGVALLNERRLEEAARQLRAALKDNEAAAHVHYALALAVGMQGNHADAAAHLGRAIELDPGTRNAARNDAEFQPMLADPLIRSVVAG